MGRLYNLASSEFFVLPTSSCINNNKKLDLLTGQYSPFGYIIDNYDNYDNYTANNVVGGGGGGSDGGGMNVLDNLLPGDIISETIVSETGLNYLVKIRQASFPDLLQGDD